MPNRQLPEIRSIVFDFDGTLTDFIASDRLALQALHAHASVLVPFEIFLDASVSAIMQFHQRVEENRSDPAAMHVERLRETFSLVEENWNDDYAILYRDNLINMCTPLQGTHELLSSLRTGFKLGLLTNAYDGEEQRLRLKKSGLDIYFDVIVVSGEVGIFKPNPLIFQHTLNLLGVKPHEALYVGDSHAHDVEGAVAANMRAVLLNRRGHPLAWLHSPTLQHLAEQWLE